MSPERRREIARLGFDALVAKHFKGDREAAINYLTAKGRWSVDKHYSEDLRKFHDPDEPEIPGPSPYVQRALAERKSL